jgi:septum formation protein
MKSENVRQLQERCDGTVLAADTVCIVNKEIIGQPNDSDEAFSMILSMTNREHEVCTGWCLQSLNGDRIQVGFEVATITLGHISEDDIFNYVATGAWKGKAGGYNLSERIVAGWPIDCEGDPTSVMGLPMIQLLKELASD